MNIDIYIYIYIYIKTCRINAEKTFRYAVQKNWNLYSLKSIPNKQSCILGTIYDCPSMKHFKFNNEYMEELLRVIKHENKNCILTGDFKLNLLKHAKSPGVSKFLENLLSHNFMPQITLPTNNRKNHNPH